MEPDFSKLYYPILSSAPVSDLDVGGDINTNFLYKDGKLRPLDELTRTVPQAELRAALNQAIGKLPDASTDTGDKMTGKGRMVDDGYISAKSNNG